MSDQSSAPGGVFSGLKGCVFAGLLAAAAIALVWTIPWEDVFRVIFDLSWRFPALSLALPAGMLVTLFCAISKGLVKSSVARILVKIAFPSLIAWLMVALISLIERGHLVLGSTSDYVAIMQTSPENLADMDNLTFYSGRLVHKMSKSAEGNAWIAAKECAYVVEEGSPYYKMRLNGAPVGRVACHDGVNVLEWEYIQQ